MDFNNGGNIDADAGRAAIADPSRQLLGDEQTSWLEVDFTPDAVAASWQFVSAIDSEDYTLLQGRVRKISVSAEDLRL